MPPVLPCCRLRLQEKEAAALAAVLEDQHAADCTAAATVIMAPALRYHCLCGSEVDQATADVTLRQRLMHDAVRHLRSNVVRSGAGGLLL
jgi:tetrahydromethanopterin S-methyltransferase subunit A